MELIKYIISELSKSQNHFFGGLIIILIISEVIKTFIVEFFSVLKFLLTIDKTDKKDEDSTK